MAGYELVITGDLNDSTKSAVGFDGDSAIFGDCFMPDDMRRLSDCKHKKFNANGHAMLTLCERAEMVIMNGLQLPTHDCFFASSAVTREETSSARALMVDERAYDADFSDHSPVCAVFKSCERLRDGSGDSPVPRSSQVAGWAFLDKLAKDREGLYVQTVLADARLDEALQMLATHNTADDAREVGAACTQYGTWGVTFGMGDSRLPG